MTVPRDLSKVEALYTENLREKGVTAAAVGWNSSESQRLRFEKSETIFEIFQLFPLDGLSRLVQFRDQPRRGLRPQGCQQDLPGVATQGKKPLGQRLTVRGIGNGFGEESPQQNFEGQEKWLHLLANGRARHEPDRRDRA